MEGLREFIAMYRQKKRGLCLTVGEARCFEKAKDEVSRWNAVTATAPWDRPESAKRTKTARG